MELEVTRDSAECTTNEARRRGEAATQVMEQWLEKAEMIIIDARKLLSKLEERERRKSKICCTSLKKRYVSSKKAVKLLQIVNEVKGSVQQIPVSQPEPPPSIEMMPTGDFEAFESTRAAIRKILEAIKHDDNQVIGVYGMGGVGKTSLIKEVARYTKIKGLFDEVVIATVSRNPDIRKIQREIAEGLGLQLIEESEHVRSLRLARRLKQDSRIFVILDDVWERIDLSHVGISSGKDKSCCKIAITTRSLDVCSEMNCDRSIMINTFSEQESWDLFKKVAGNVVDSPDLNNLASEIVKECGGLPIALVTLGRVLRNKEPRFWDDAAYELRQSRPLNIKGMHENVFSCLKLSFDEFQNEEAQMCFLYCALFPEDYDVQVEDLLRYGIGERLFSDVMTLDQARNRVHSIISNLKASCLLLNDTDNDQVCVKLHDVFRDLAISIATTNDYSFMVKASSGLKEWPSTFKLEYVMRMSLINNEISVFSGQGEYPELILLLLQNNKSLKSISDEFFAGMKALQVLDLSNIPSLVTLPTSLSSLTNLRTLCMDNNNLKDGSALGDLRSIEILSLRKSSFGTFPEEIKRLTNLRLLDLSDSQVGEIPGEVFSSLLLLEELYMGGSYNGWEIKETKSMGKATLAEVLSLERLNILHIDIGNYACLTEEITSQQPGVKKFQIHIGERVISPLNTNTTNMCFNIPPHYRLPKPLMNWVKSFLQTTLQLSILSWKHLSSLEDLQPDYLQLLKYLQIQQCHFQICFSSTLFKSFKSLQELQILSCFELTTVFLFNDKVPQDNVLPTLTNIHVHDSPSLTALWKGAAPYTGFQSLKHVKVELCRKIKILFPLAIAKLLNQLQYLEIANCDAMEAVICSNFGGHEVQTNTWSSQPDFIPTGVEFINLYTQPLFPKLESLKLNNLKYITSLTQPPFPFDFPKLEHLTVLSCPSFKLRLRYKDLQGLIEIKAEKKWFREMEVEDDNIKKALEQRFTGKS
ncbi:hypothetical protein RDABS01_015764 [Bienertia sinuspersici]